MSAWAGGGGGGDPGGAGGEGGGFPAQPTGPPGGPPLSQPTGGAAFGGNVPSQFPAPAAAPQKTKAPRDPALDTVILMATDAVKMDNAGRYRDAKQSYMLAAEELIRVCRAQPDPLRKTAYKKRADTYLKRAEAIDRMMRQQVSQKRRSHEAQRTAHWFVAVLGKELQFPGGDGDGDGKTTSAVGEKKPTGEALAGRKIVCVFVGANWNESCRTFLPELQKLYTLVEEQHPGELQIVYASQDRTRADFDALYKAQSWPCVPFENKGQMGFLLAHCKFYGSKLGLIVLNARNGKVLVRNAAPHVLKDPSPATYEAWAKLLPPS